MEQLYLSLLTMLAVMITGTHLHLPMISNPNGLPNKGYTHTLHSAFKTNCITKSWVIENEE